MASLQDHDVVTFDEVHESVFLVDPARPGAGEGVTELLWLANPYERVACDVIE